MSQSEHTLPPLAHEAMREFLPGVERTVAETVRIIRARPGWGDASLLGRGELVDLDPVQAFLKEVARREYNRGATEEQADFEANFAGNHLWYLLNFELHRRKVFWVDGPLAWMLLETRLDIEGDVLRLPFPSFCVVFTDRATLEVGEALLKQTDCAFRDQPLRILSTYVARTPEPGEGTMLSVSLLFDARTGKWPYLLSRDLVVRPADRLDAILDSRAPGVDIAKLDPTFRTPELRTLVHLVTNAILYATSASTDWPLLGSPVHRARQAAAGKGEKRRRRAFGRARELGGAFSGERVYFLPGKIPISMVRQFCEMQKDEEGRKLMARFMVRGHWRRANPTWVDQKPRWIEPYWKGPEMAAIIERQYRMKP